MPPRRTRLSAPTRRASRSGLKDLGLGAVEAGGGDLGDASSLEAVEGVVDEALGDAGPGRNAVEEAEQQGRREKQNQGSVHQWAGGGAGENAAGRGTPAPGRGWRVVGCIKLSKY